MSDELRIENARRLGWTDIHGGPPQGAYWRGTNPKTGRVEEIPSDTPETDSIARRLYRAPAKLLALSRCLERERDGLLEALDHLQANPNDPRCHRRALDAIAKAKGEK